MERVTLHNKTFQVSIPEERILQAIKQMAQQLNQDLKDVDKPLFLSILNGSFMFTSDLMKQLNLKCELSFLKLSSYSGTQSSGKVQELIGLSGCIKGRTVVILEDIVDSGNTLEVLVELLKSYEPKEVKVASLLFKPDAYKKSLKIDYIGIPIANDFIVGYGLDYDEMGRNLKDIYTLVS